MTTATVPTVEDALKEAVTSKGINLYDLSDQSAVLVVFLRHFGCTFCRETVDELVRLRRPLEQNGVRLAFVHMGTEAEADAFFAHYGIEDQHLVSDPERRLYKAFDLRRGTFGQLLGPLVWWRGLKDGAFKRYGVGKPKGNEDEYQMPGVFLIHKGAIEKAYRHKRVSDRPDYLELAECDICDTVPSPEDVKPI